MLKCYLVFAILLHFSLMWADGRVVRELDLTPAVLWFDPRLGQSLVHAQDTCQIDWRQTRFE